MSSPRPWCLVLVGCVAIAFGADRARAQSPARGSIHGTATTVDGAPAPAGVVITLTSEPASAEPAVTATDARGEFLFASIPAGRYRIRAELAGFRPVERRELVVRGGDNLVVDLVVALAVSADVDTVVAADRMSATSSADTVRGELFDIAPVKGDDYQALLPLLPGVLRGPDGRINLKGGRPTQTGLQLSQAYVSDPSTGDTGFGLPVDAIESVTVLPNPYAAEYGRFSSGVTRIETRRGTDTWRTSASNFVPVPCLKICDLQSLGVRAWDPRFVIGGPLWKDRLFLAQSVQAHYHAQRVPVLPSANDDTTSKSLEAFTRLDAALGNQSLTATVATFPKSLDFVNLNTFNPQPVTPRFDQTGYNLGLTHALPLGGSGLAESNINLKQYNVRVDGHGDGPMVLAPSVNSGRYFNRQDRRTRTVQVTESLTLGRHAAGDHVIKLGLDLLHLSLDGESESRPVEVRRDDGTLDQRLTFDGPAHVDAVTTDAGAYAQDTWRVNDRVLTEGGIRIDRDGVLGRTHVSPRLGVVLGLLPEGRSILRGGVGRFFERTPLLVAAFEQFETRTVTRFAADGATPVAAGVRFANRVDGPLDTPSGLVWNAEFDQRVGTVVLKVNHLERSGAHAFLVVPAESGGGGTLSLNSSGRSHYRETEITARYRGRETPGAVVLREPNELTVTYVRSQSRADLNAFDVYFGNFRSPVVRPNQYSLADFDVPNRLVVLAAFTAAKWRVAPLVELRNGFPFSVVDQSLNYVGLRNASERFPVFTSLDLSISREVTIRHRHIRLGLRANHLLNNWTPRDVQVNTGSPQFGTFYNTIVPRFGFTFELQ